VSDPKLYKITSTDYGVWSRRFIGTIQYSLVFGLPFCLVLVAAYELMYESASTSAGLYDRFIVESALALLALLAFLVTRRVYVYDLEIAPDYLICYYKGKSLRVDRLEARVIPESSRLTWFGRSKGLVVGHAWKGSVFIPKANPAYEEIWSKLAAWRSASAG
jgi:hypothetical protein